MKTARIYQKPKNAMQSGRARTDSWILEIEPTSAQKPDALTGWAGGGDTTNQLHLTFPDLAAATAYADREGIGYNVVPAPARTLKLQTYADNFR